MKAGSHTNYLNQEFVQFTLGTDVIHHGRPQIRCQTDRTISGQKVMKCNLEVSED